MKTKHRYTGVLALILLRLVSVNVSAADYCPSVLVYLTQISEQGHMVPKPCTYDMFQAVAFQKIKGGYLIIPQYGYPMAPRPAIFRTKATYQLGENLIGKATYKGEAEYNSLLGFPVKAYEFEAVK